mmetsp:Transcript_65373/g.116311  ORF Transcript_65373/g.116311 Transcript_65373/m.116311 type:complete len:495 (-) Transcript_65373:9-1493(-)
MPRSDSDSENESTKSSTQSSTRSSSRASSRSSASSRTSSHSSHKSGSDSSTHDDFDNASERFSVAETPTAADGPPEGDVKSLKRSNEELRKKLMQLNSQLDYELAHQGKDRGPRYGKADEQKIAKLKAQSEELRRENDLLKKQVYQADGVCRVTDLHNQVLQRDQQIRTLKEANRGLDNVQRNQSKKMDVVNQIEGEMDRIRSAHNEELYTIKERLRRLKEAKEADEKMVRKLQNQINQMEDKIQLAKKLKASSGGKSLEEVQEMIRTKESKVETCQKDIERLQRQIEAERRRAGQRITQRDVDQLKKTAAALRQKLAEREHGLNLAQIALRKSLGPPRPKEENILRQSVDSAASEPNAKPGSMDDSVVTSARSEGSQKEDAQAKAADADSDEDGDADKDSDGSKEDDDEDAKDDDEDASDGKSAASSPASSPESRKSNASDSDDDSGNESNAADKKESKHDDDEEETTTPEPEPSRPVRRSGPFGFSSKRRGS